MQGLPLPKDLTATSNTVFFLYRILSQEMLLHARSLPTHVLNLFGNLSFRTGYFEMRCSKSCYLRDLELGNMFDNEVIEHVHFLYAFQIAVASQNDDDNRIFYAAKISVVLPFALKHFKCIF